MEKEQIIKALECCIQFCDHGNMAVCKECPLKECRCSVEMPKNALALIKELTEENERLKKDNEYILMQHAFQRRPSGDCWNDVIEKAKADTVREIFKEIYSSLDYIEEQMEPEEIPECFFSVREDINALKEKFESEGRGE